MEKVVFTNGCFDLIHPGHIDLLKKARALGTKLIVGLNSDVSVRAIKGNSRPFLNQKARAAVLQELRSVDEVRIFDENTPEELIREIKPDVLVKGGDWAIDQIVGSDFVLKNGGEVFSIPFVEDFSTSKIAEKIKFSEDFAKSPDFEKNKESDLIKEFFKTNIEVYENLLNTQVLNITRCAEIIVSTLKNDGKIFICGKKENLQDLQHWLTKFTSQLDEKKQFIRVFLLSGQIGKQLKERAKKGDLLISFIADGQSPDVISAVMKAREAGCRTIALMGLNNVKLAGICDASVAVPTEKAGIVSLVQIAVGSLWRQLVEKKMQDSAEFQNG